MWERWGDGTPPSLSRRAAALASQPAVLFGDACGHFAPLQCLYFDSRSALVSAHPDSSSTDVSSSYCPGCFDIVKRGNRCLRCFDCPRCGSTLTAGRDGGGGGGGGSPWTLKCTYCDWDSAVLGLVAEEPEQLSATLSRWLDVEVAGGGTTTTTTTSSTGSSTTSTGGRGGSGGEATMACVAGQQRLFADLVEHFSSGSSAAAARAAHNNYNNSPFKNSKKSAASRSVSSPSWQPEDADALVAERAALRRAACEAGFAFPRNASPAYASLLPSATEAAGAGGDADDDNNDDNGGGDDGDDDDGDGPGNSSASTTNTNTNTNTSDGVGAVAQLVDGPSLPQRLCGEVGPASQPASWAAALPSRKLMIGRRERRSVEEVAAGRPGILVMPKMNPLEGDSSSPAKVKQGEWWRKNRAATFFAPRVTIDATADPRTPQSPQSQSPAVAAAVLQRRRVAGSTDSTDEGAAPERLVLCLRISNPRHNAMTVWLGPPSQQRKEQREPLSELGDRLRLLALPLSPPPEGSKGWRVKNDEGKDGEAKEEQEEGAAEEEEGIVLEPHEEEFLTGGAGESAGPGKGAAAAAAAAAARSSGSAALPLLRNRRKNTAWVQFAVDEIAAARTSKVARPGQSVSYAAALTLTVIEVRHRTILASIGPS